MGITINSLRHKANPACLCVVQHKEERKGTPSHEYLVHYYAIDELPESDRLSDPARRMTTAECCEALQVQCRRSWQNSMVCPLTLPSLKLTHLIGTQKTKLLCTNRSTFLSQNGRKVVHVGKLEVHV
jgi:hypothetical protein